MLSSTTFRAGLQIPNFNLPRTEPADLLERLSAIAQTAENSGFDALYLMDHLHQIEGVGPEDGWMLEGPTALCALAARTSRIHLGLMVAGITYRNPALMAKITTTIDVLSGGRAILGIGAAWNESEHRAYGFRFPPLKERFELLEDGVRIMRAMFTEERATVTGTRVSVDNAYNNPKPLRGDIPILIGGSGERKTLRLVARYAEASNVFGDVDRIKHLMGVIDAHCADVGRDPAEISRTKLATLVITDTRAAGEAKAKELREAWGDESFDGYILCGDRDSLAEQLAAHRDAGLTGVIVDLPDPTDLEQVQAAGEVLAAAFR
jgi:F420-dependent oxidoreductase-like protein